MSAGLQTLEAGFTEPVFGSQNAFRALMQALAFPGELTAMPDEHGAPAGWPRALAGAALTLLDADTAVWLDGAARSRGAEAFLKFHTGCRIAEAPNNTDFAIILDPGAAPFDQFKIGEDAFPDRSATLLIAIPSLEGGQALCLTGPGIKTTRDIAPAGDLAPFWQAWPRNHSLYPLGYDAFFFTDGAVLGLPRGVAAEPIMGDA